MYKKSQQSQNESDRRLPPLFFCPSLKWSEVVSQALEKVCKFEKEVRSDYGLNLMSAPREGRQPRGVCLDVDSSKGAEGCTASVGQQHVSHAGMLLNGYW